MRNSPNCRAENYRVREGDLQSFTGDGNNGAFRVPVGKSVLWCIVSDVIGWDHVSVSVMGEKRCPTWEEMCAVRDLFFHDGEWVLQYHPAKKDHVSDHEYCLHLWRPQNESIPTPPSAMVGPGVGPDRAALLGRAGMEILAGEMP